MLDDAEHLGDAVVLVAEQGADRGGAVAEGELAGGRHLQAHLLLDVGRVDAVALAELTGLGVDVELRHDEQRQALGARTGSLRASQHEVHDVVGHVRLAGGDEALHARDVPGAVGLLHGLGAAGADVGTGVGLGEHHRAVPALLHDVVGKLLLLVSAEQVEQLAEGVAGGEHRDGRVGAEHHLVHRPLQARRRDRATQLLVDVDAPEARLLVGAVALLERLRHGDRLGLRVVDRRVAVGVDEGRGEVGLGETRDLLDHFACGVGVEVGVRTGAEHLVATEHLEEVELDVTDVALVVSQLSRSCSKAAALLVAIGIDRYR